MMQPYIPAFGLVDISKDKLILPEGVIRYRIKTQIGRFATIVLMFKDRFEHYTLNKTEDGYVPVQCQRVNLIKENEDVVKTIVSTEKCVIPNPSGYGLVNRIKLTFSDNTTMVFNQKY